jgi:hypothetical protein
MPRRRGTRDTYTGHGGQMAVMAELLLRGCNVAIPEVDVGTDVFAFRDDQEEVARIQVKTARGRRYKKGEGCSAQFDLPLKHLQAPDSPPLYYVLAVRLGERWADFLIIWRPLIERFWDQGRSFGTVSQGSGSLILTVQFRPDGVRCGQVDLTPFRNAWDQLPPLRPSAATLSGDEEPSP